MVYMLLSRERARGGGGRGQSERPVKFSWPDYFLHEPNRLDQSELDRPPDFSTSVRRENDIWTMNTLINLYQLQLTIYSEASPFRSFGSIQSFECGFRPLLANSSDKLKADASNAEHPTKIITFLNPKLPNVLKATGLSSFDSGV